MEIIKDRKENYISRKNRLNFYVKKCTPESIEPGKSWKSNDVTLKVSINSDTMKAIMDNRIYVFSDISKKD